MIGEYLTLKQLSELLVLKPKSISNKMAMGIFRHGVHYFHPKGIGVRFKRSEIIKWLEEKDHLAEVDIGTGATPDIEIPMSRGYLLRSGR